MGLEKSFLPCDTFFTFPETVHVRAVLNGAASQSCLSMKGATAAAKGNYVPVPAVQAPGSGSALSPDRLLWGQRPVLRL